MDDKEDLTKELQWVKYRIQILDMIEERLLIMRQLAEVVRDNKLNENEIREINQRIEKLVNEINALDEESREDYIY
jgi:chorismate mutase